MQISNNNLNVKESEHLIDLLLAEKPKKKPIQKFIFKDMRIFVNTISKAVDMMKRSGVKAEYVTLNESDKIIYKIIVDRQNI